MINRAMVFIIPTTTLMSLLAACVFAVTFGQSAANAASIQSEQSSLAILTDKEGLAAGLAHRHIIVASKWSGTLQLAKKAAPATSLLSSISSGEATIIISAKDLIVDSPEAAKGILGVLVEAKHWDVQKDKLEPGNATKVRDNMLDESQLSAEKFQTIEGNGLFSSCEKLTDASVTCALDLNLKVRGQTVAKKVSVILKQQGTAIVAELFVPYRFSEFGIKAYTAMFGAIAVKDEFFLGARLVSTEP
jgi:hypothetical protein